MAFEHLLWSGVKVLVILVTTEAKLLLRAEISVK